MSQQGMRCPITGSSLKSVLICTIVGFVVLFGYNYVMHAHMLSGIYALTPHLWRTVEDMQNHSLHLMLMYLLMSFASAELYCRFARASGLGEGLRFGLLLGLLLAAVRAAPFAWLPITAELAWFWFLVGFGEGMVMGLVFSFLYKPE